MHRLFAAVVGLPASERRRALDDPAVDPRVRTEVESLLEYDAGGDHTIASAVSAAAADLIDDRTPAGLPGWGPYRPLRLIGAGGMSTVYLAERTDGEVRQRVAVKVLRGGVGRSAAERFLRERQVLAAMSHPGIARLQDAGHTSAGEPYLVMELVEGVAIDEYCAALDVRARLRLFARVCDAVAYAHRRLVIHRDIKPSNILVDAEGQPKLLDFGIAKLLDAPGDRTHTSDRWLTPGYASPEQRRGAADTTATDVYSLGAVLYRLLTGQPPGDEGVRPTDPALSREVPADAWYILRKALRAEPGERYGSVEALALDVEALLDWRPVDARAGDRWYRTRRFLRRYRAAAAMAVLVMSALAAGLLVASRERTVAEHRFAQVRQLANQVLALDASLRIVPGATGVRQQVVDISCGYLEALAAEVGDDPGLALELGTAYLKVARVQGVPAQSNLGRHDDARASLGRAEALLEVALGARTPDPLAILTRAEVSHDQMILADTGREDAVALARAADASAGVEAFLAVATGTPDERARAAKVFTNVALLYKNQHRYDDCVRIARQALAIGLQSDDQLRANALSLVADALRLSGDLRGAWEAIAEARASLASAESSSTVGVINRYNVLWREGVILGGDGQINLGRPDEAIVSLQQAFDALDALARQDPRDSLGRLRMATAGRELGGILRHRDPARALAVYDHALSRLRELESSAAARRAEADVMARSAWVLRRLGRGAEARQRIDRALALLRDIKAYPAARIPPSSDVEYAVGAWADHLADTGHLREAAGVYQGLLDAVMQSNPVPRTDLSHATSLSRLYGALADLYVRVGAPDRAAPLAASRRAVWQGWSQRLPSNGYVQQQLEAAGER